MNFTQTIPPTVSFKKAPSTQLCNSPGYEEAETAMTVKEVECATDSESDLTFLFSNSTKNNISLFIITSK